MQPVSFFSLLAVSAVLLVLLGAPILAAFAEDPRFTAWTQEYEKTYRRASDRVHAHRNFLASLDRVTALNARALSLASGARYELGQFADLSVDEFSTRYLMPSFKPSPFPEGIYQPPALAADELPSSMFWNDVTPPVVTKVKNQEQCGSCWAFSTTESVESAWAMAGLPIVELAPQALVSCDSLNGGCNGGDTMIAYAWVIENPGMELEDTYPYSSGKGKVAKCNVSVSESVVSIKGYTTPTESKNMTELISGLVEGGPVSVCLSSSGWQHYSSGILSHKECEGGIDHCVQLTGYTLGNATAPGYMTVRNSWGAKHFGKNPGWPGYIFLELDLPNNVNTCKIADYATVAIADVGFTPPIGL